MLSLSASHQHYSLHAQHCCCYQEMQRNSLTMCWEVAVKAAMWPGIAPKSNPAAPPPSLQHGSPSRPNPHYTCTTSLRGGACHNCMETAFPGDRGYMLQHWCFHFTGNRLTGTAVPDNPHQISRSAYLRKALAELSFVMSCTFTELTHTGFQGLRESRSWTFVPP